MQLCGHSVSPYVERILIVLEMKGIADAVVLSDVPGGFKSDEHFTYHPLGKIPFLLLDDGQSLTESQVIVEYLDAVLDGRKVIPTDPFAAATASQISRVLDIYYTNAIGPMGRVAFGGSATDDELAKARDIDIPAALGYLEKLINGSEYAVGDSWSHADAALMTHFYWFERLMPEFGVNGFGGYPNLSAYWNHVTGTDLYKDSKARADASFDKFFGGKP
ncbi:glutathione S-transferase family protein [Kordiimonas aquimaris]|uniref:glutathione S-transferase family protein n=1 Tax=Kordiimonas aquimaris TaxID=707591 RepID=UPI0021D39183|nr:glutathione S-transferase family protein [Kordiimonas aquimaris]